MGEGECGDKAGQDEPEDKEDDAENNHVCAFLIWQLVLGDPVSGGRSTWVKSTTPKGEAVHP
jgi:hypothetical protein